MAINITPLLDALQAKLASADSDTALTDINALNYLSTYASNTNNVIRYPTISFLNIEGTGDSADSYTGDFGYDISNNNYYFRAGFQWNELTLNDSAAINQTPNVGSVQAVQISGGTTPTTAATDIQTFPFAADGTSAVTVGNLNNARYYHFGATDGNIGQTAGGIITGTTSDDVESFPFSNPTTSTTLSNLGQTRQRGTSNHSVGDAKGYASGGSSLPGTTFTDEIRKYDIVTSGTVSGTSVGNLSVERTGGMQGYQSTSDAYQHGGYQNPPFGLHVTIDKFPFANETVSTLPASANLSPNTQGADTCAIYNEEKGIVGADIGTFMDVIPFASEVRTSAPSPTGIAADGLRFSGFSSTNGNGYFQFAQQGPGPANGTRVNVPYQNITPIAVPGGGTSVSVFRGTGVQQ